MQVSWLADGLVQQGRRHARIHPAAQPQNDPFPAHFRPDFLHRARDEMAHGPFAPAAADAVDEIGEDFPPARRVRHFGVKLQPEKFPRRVLDGRELRIVRSGDGLEAPGNSGELVAVRIPDLEGAGQPGKQRPRAVFDR